MSTKLYAVIWHWIESDGLCGAFTTIEKAKEASERIVRESMEGTSATIHEIEVDRFYKDEPEEIT